MPENNEIMFHDAKQTQGDTSNNKGHKITECNY